MKNHFTANVTTSTTREYDVINMSNATPLDSLGTFVASGLGMRLSNAVAMTFNLGVYNFSSGMISYFLREIMLLCILQKSHCLTARFGGLPFDSSDNAQCHISSGKLQPPG